MSNPSTSGSESDSDESEEECSQSPRSVEWGNPYSDSDDEPEQRCPSPFSITREDPDDNIDLKTSVVVFLVPHTVTWGNLKRQPYTQHAGSNYAGQRTLTVNEQIVLTCRWQSGLPAAPLSA